MIGVMAAGFAPLACCGRRGLPRFRRRMWGRTNYELEMLHVKHLPQDAVEEAGFAGFIFNET